MSQPLRQTPLYSLHQEQGARFAPFAGYDMPVRFAGTLAEHAHCRRAASLFDVSHMAQADLHAPPEAVENLLPAAASTMAQGEQRYTLLLNEQGGIRDDLMIVRRGENAFRLIVNAACRDKDFAVFAEKFAGDFTPRPDLALLALQGPQAALTLNRLAKGAADMRFMTAAQMRVAEVDCLVSRSGYTGEDGYEISCAAREAESLARKLAAAPDVMPAGLAARDSLRLEAGLCLYGQDIDETTTPAEAMLMWTIPLARREQANFTGGKALQNHKPQRQRIGLVSESKRPVRRGWKIINPESGKPAGEVSSGGVAPTSPMPFAMGYVFLPAPEKTLLLHPPAGADVPALRHKMPFYPHKYFRP